MVDLSETRLRSSKLRLKVSLAQFNSAAVRFAARNRRRAIQGGRSTINWLKILSYSLIICIIVALLAFLIVQLGFPKLIALI